MKLKLPSYKAFLSLLYLKDRVEKRDEFDEEAEYEQSFAWLCVESPDQDQLKDFVLRMRQKGLKQSGCNNRIRAVNAYLKWARITAPCTQAQRRTDFSDDERKDIQQVVEWTREYADSLDLLSDLPEAIEEFVRPKHWWLE